MRRSMHLSGVGACWLALGLAGSLAVATETPTRDDPAPAPQQAAERPASETEAPSLGSGLVVRWNAELNRMEPAQAEELAVLVEQLRGALEERLQGTAFGESKTVMNPEVLPSGAVRQKLGLEHLHFFKVDVRSGEPAAVCATDPAMAATVKAPREVER